MKNVSIFMILLGFLCTTDARAGCSIMDSGVSANLNGVWGSSGNDVFAVGDGGTILHYDGLSWSSMGSGTGEHLNDVWGSSGTDVFAVGNNGAILRFDGSVWSPMESGTSENLIDVWGSSGTDVFAVGNYGAILHFDNSDWSTIEAGIAGGAFLTSVWGSGGDVFAVVRQYPWYGSCMYHYDGSGWYEMSCGFGTLRDIWGLSATDIFAVGADGNQFAEWGYFLHYDGTVWNPVISNHPVGSPVIMDIPLFSIWGMSGADIYLGGSTLYHYDGSDTLYRISCDPVLYVKGMWGSSGTDVFTVGSLGRVVHYDGDNDSDGFLDGADNCPDDYNPLQDDALPPQGNGMGDACDCEGDFDCDSDTDGTDAAIFKIDFGRSTFKRPCISADTCNGDFSCDGDVDGTDAAIFKQDFGRSQFQNPCPNCVAGVEWCQY